MENKEYFYSLKDIKYQLVDSLGLIWDGKMWDPGYQREIDTTLESLEANYVNHLIVRGRVGEFDLMVTVDNKRFFTWRDDRSQYDTTSSKVKDKDLSKEWQERLLQKNGQKYAEFLGDTNSSEMSL